MSLTIVPSVKARDSFHVCTMHRKTEPHQSCVRDSSAANLREGFANGLHDTGCGTVLLVCLRQRCIMHEAIFVFPPLLCGWAIHHPGEVSAFSVLSVLCTTI